MEGGRQLYDLLVLVALTAVSAVLIVSGVAEVVTRPSGDALLRLASQRPPTPPADQPEVLLVAIDPQSLRARPQWPWPRSIHAQAIRRLHASGAKVVAFDVDFSTPRDDREDRELVGAVSDAGNVVLAAFRQLQQLPGGVVLEIANTPFPELRAAAAAVASVHMEVDPDGVLRRTPASISIRGDAVPSLSAAALAIASGRAPAPTPESAAPVDYRRARPAIPVLSMIDVVEGRFDPRDVAGRVVLIGATAAEFQDLWSTPLGPARPGVWIQAMAFRTATAQAAGQTVLRTPAASTRVATVSAVLLVAALLGWATDGLRRSAALAAWGSLVVGVGIGAVGLLVLFGWLIDPVVPLASLATQHVVGLERVRRRFGVRIAERERSIAALARVGEATVTPASGDAGLGVALALLGDVVDASGVSLLRASAEGVLDGRRLDWQRRGSEVIGDGEVAQRVLEGGEVRVFDRERPGREGVGGTAVYTPLQAGALPIGVLVVERDGDERLDVVALRTIATVAMQLTLSAHNLALLDDLRTTFDSSIEAIASAVEARDGYTEQHCRRLAAFSGLMAQHLGLDANEIEAIRLGALLHDVGKVGIRDEVLLKPGRFTPEEREVMESHVVIGHGIISGIHGLLDSTLACVRHHHERWDGRGYPDGLRGEQIPLGARIVAVVDVWDALSTARPYKPALEQARVRDILRKDRGSHFEPRLVDLFLELLDEEGDELLAWLDSDLRREA